MEPTIESATQPQTEPHPEATTQDKLTGRPETINRKERGLKVEKGEIGQRGGNKQGITSAGADPAKDFLRKSDAPVAVRSLANTYGVDYDQMIELTGTDERLSLDPNRRSEARRGLAISKKLKTFLVRARKNV